MSTLYIRDSAGFREAGSDEILKHAQTLIARRFRLGCPVLTSPNKVREYLKLHLGTLEYELFGVLHLDTRRRLIAVEDLFRGTIDSAAVHPREVVKSALRYGSSALILFHNHPLC
jgi:DNA repair protein RadC